MLLTNSCIKIFRKIREYYVTQLSRARGGFFKFFAKKSARSASLAQSMSDGAVPVFVFSKGKDDPKGSEKKDLIKNIYLKEKDSAPTVYYKFNSSLSQEIFECK